MADLREELGEALKDVPEDGVTASMDEPVAQSSAETVAPDAKPADAKPADAKADTPAPDKTEKPADGERPRGPDGKFLKLEKTEADKPAEGAAKPADAQAQQTPAVVDLAPSTWTPAAKAEYAKLPEVVRNEIKKREGDMQKGIAQYKSAAEQGSRLMAEFQPYMQMIQSEGGTPEKAVRSLLNTAYQLRTGTPQQRGALVMQIIKQYGADMSAYTLQSGGVQAEQQQGAAQGIDQNALASMVQSALAPHLQKIEQVSSRFQTAEQQQAQAQQQQIDGQIEAFRSAADEKGQPRHPYFDNVRTLMAAIIENGNAPDMETAYVMACRADPEVSKVLDAAQRQQDEAARLAEQKRLADEARRVHTANAEGQGSVGVIDTSKLSLRDELGQRLSATGAI